jgi:short-chain fatty acids transporter
MTTASKPDSVAHKPGNGREGAIARCGLALANWSERWFPDPLVFAFIGIVVVFLIGLLLRESPSKLAIAGGKSYWFRSPCRW